MVFIRKNRNQYTIVRASGPSGSPYYQFPFDTIATNHVPILPRAENRNYDFIEITPDLYYVLATHTKELLEYSSIPAATHDPTIKA